jgi:hypothetical protein
MADKGKKDEEGFGDEEDFGALTSGSSSSGGKGEGLHSLPPLSEFDSASDSGTSDSDLPPLDSPGAEDDESFSGLPPIVDIRVDTPAVRPSDLDTPTPGKRTPSTRTPSKRTPTGPSGAKTVPTPSPAGFKTPSDSDLASPSDGGFGFQDFAADSDFSPETPEIGPGPDSDIETPMFDSAFGGDSDEFTSAKSNAPTQAMQTPMFGAAKGSGGGFGDDAFAATPDAGTPVPDFSPDTGAGISRDTGGLTPAPVGVVRRRGSRLQTALISLAALILGLIGGMFYGPFASHSALPLVPNPFKADLDEKDRIISQQKQQIAKLSTIQGTTGKQVTQEELDRLIAKFNETNAKLSGVNDELAKRNEELSTLNNQIALVKADIDEKNDAFIEAQEALAVLKNDTAITRARHDGLLAENERLTGAVGELEVANARRAATKDTLQHNAELLVVQIQGGSPLTPARYDYQQRLARASSLREKIAKAKWVDPQLLDEYTSLYLAELAIAASREYFYARIPLKDDLGNPFYMWAECLMNGNWSVYFRTIDGKTVGSYENTAGSGPPKYEFRQDLPPGMRDDIVQGIEAARPVGWEDKFKDLEAKQAIYQTQTKLQRNFSSLQ